MIIIKETTPFKKDFKKYYRDKKVKSILTNVLDIIIKNEELPINYNNHRLKGKYKDYYECHLLPDLLLIYKITGDNLILVRIGSHSDLF